MARMESEAWDYTYGRSEYGSKYWLPGGMPDWNYDFWGRNKYRTGACPDYDKAVKDFQKAAAEYDSLERGLFGIKDDAKKNKIIARAKEAQSRGKAAARNCKAATKIATGKYDDDAAAMQAGQQMQQAGGAGSSPIDQAIAGGGQQQVSDAGAAGGGGNTMIYVGVGAVVLIGGALFLKKRKKKKLPATMAVPA